MRAMRWRDKIPKRPSKVVYGPVKPRINRFRSKEWVCYPTFKLRTLARNGITKAITYDQTATSGNPMRGYSYCNDTVPNPEYYLPRSDLIDDGGEFWLRQAFWTAQPTPFSHGWIRNTRRYGQLWVVTPEKLDGTLLIVGAKSPPSEDGDIAGYGPTGYARAKPAQPSFSFGQSLVELKDLPRMLQQRLRSIKDIGSAYVGAEFGWRPLLQDFQNMLIAGSKVEERLQRLLKNNGKPVRGRAFVTQVSETTLLQRDEGSVGIVYSTWPWYDPVVPKPTSAGYFSITKLYTRRVWFSGEFQYWLRDLDTPGKMLQLKLKLLGLEMTPKLLWDLTPWSWLVDWFSNVGDLIDNAVETIPERQVARYAYIMGDTRRYYTYAGSDGKHSAQATKVFVTKRRMPADRFGLAAASNLSLRQAFLLGMLGLQRIGS